MNHDDKQDALEHNLAEMFSMDRDEVTPDFEQRLVLAVDRQVQQQRRMRMRRRWFVRVAAAAAVLAMALLVARQSLIDSNEPIGTLTEIRGLVLVRNGDGVQLAEGPRSLHTEQWVQTQSGTTAQVVLTDQSRVTPQPRTIMQFDHQRQGHIVRLTKGAVAIAAQKQPERQYLTVEAPGTAIKILGTTLDVRVVEKPTGVKQTRVHLHSGTIEVASGGVSTHLLPGMVSTTEEGRPPQVESNVLEVNELRRLLQETQHRARRTGAQANMPMIVDYVNSNVWAVVPLSTFHVEAGHVYSLRLKYPAFRVKAYTQDGAQVETRAKGRTVHVDLSKRPQAAGDVTHIVLRIPHATGLFRVEDGKTYEFSTPPASAGSVTLLQLALPRSAVVDAVQGEVIERFERLGRLIVTVAADAQTLAVYE